ncbi:hypothetical protein JHK86_012914 [Glycine max]|nr:hypothetical protein JHK86_012914 [Glycine max]
MEFLFKDTIVTDFAAYAPSEDSRQYEGFNTRTKETNDNIDDNTEMEVNEPETNTTTQNMSSTKENGQRKRSREGDKRIGVAAKLSSQLDRIIQTFESSVSAQDPTSITACVVKLKDLPRLEMSSSLSSNDSSSGDDDHITKNKVLMFVVANVTNYFMNYVVKNPCTDSSMTNHR